MKRLLVLVLPVMLSSTLASACGVCCLAILDLLLPPAFLWFCWPLTWFLTTGLVLSHYQIRSLLIPGALGTFGLASGAFLLGMAEGGPFLTLPLALPAAFAFARCLKRQSPALPRPLRLFLLTIGLLHISFAAGGVLYGTQQRLQRSDAEYICRWPATPPARSLFRGLASKGAAAGPDYRYIIANSTYSNLVADACKALASVGEPDRDLPLLHGALARTPSEPEASQIRKAIAGLVAKNRNTQP